MELLNHLRGRYADRAHEQGRLFVDDHVDEFVQLSCMNKLDDDDDL